MRLSTTAGRPEEATPSPRRLAEQALHYHGLPPPVSTARRDTAWLKLLPRLEGRSLWELARLEKTPQRNEYLARHRHNPDAPQTLATASEALAKPHTQGTVRLKAQPTPRQLGGHPAHMPVAGLGNPLFSGTLAALIRRWCEAR